MLFPFVLFAILGWCLFVPGTAARMVLMVVFIVLMILWLAAGVTGFEIPLRVR